MLTRSFASSLGSLLFGLAIGFIAVLGLLPHQLPEKEHDDMSPQRAFSGSVLAAPGDAASGASSEGASTTPAVGEMSIGDLLAEKNPFQRTTDEYAFVESLGQDAVTTALGQMSGLPQGTRQLELEKLLLAKLAKTDPKGALTLVAGISNAHASMELAEPLLKEWIARDQAAAWTWGESLPDGMEKTRLLSAALADESKADPAGTANYILQIMSQPGSNLIYGKAAAGVAQSLASTDPAAMQQFIAQLPEGYAKTEAVSAAARVMTKKDPKGAAQLLMSSRLNANITNELTSVMNGWGKKDLTAAMAFADALPAGAQKDPMRFLLPQLAAKDPSAALNEAAKINNPEVTGALMNALPQTLMIKTPDQATSIAAQLPDGDMKAQFLGRCALKLFQTNPGAATTLVDDISEGPAKTSAVAGIVNDLSWKDLPAAQQFVTSLPSGPLHDRGIEVLISDHSSGHPEQGVQWAMQYSDLQARDQAVTYQYGQWVKLDPNAAQIWLSQAPLSAAAKQQIQTAK